MWGQELRERRRGASLLYAFPSSHTLCPLCASEKGDSQMSTEWTSFLAVPMGTLARTPAVVLASPINTRYM